jgi:hypothetical protein
MMEALRKPPTEAEQAAIIEPPTRTYRLWTVDMLRLAEASADAGTLSRAAELCDALFGDDRIPALLQTRTQGIFGLVPTFEASGDGRRRNRAVRALEAGEDWWAMVPETESCQILSWGLLLGICPADLRWYDDNGAPYLNDGRHVPQLRFRHPKHLRYDATCRAWFIAVKDGQEVPFTPGDGTWFAFAPYGLNRPWAHGAWRGLARWWLLKQYAIADWGEHGERGASLFVESHPDSTRELRKQLADDLAQMAAQGVCVLPPGFKAALLEISANTTAIYQAQTDAADTAAAIRLLGHNLTSKVDGGSFAAAETGDGIRLDLRKFDAESWSTATHDQHLIHWARVNFNDAALAPWAIYPVEPKADRKMVAEELDVLSRALVQLDSAPAYIDKRAILEERGVPLLAGVDIEAPNPPPQAPGQPPMPPEAPASGEVEDPEEADPEADPDAEDDGEEADDGEEEDDAEELTLLGRHDHINFKPPKGVRAACKRGVQLYEEGHGGDGLRPATIRWARRLAAGNDITPDKARLMRAWLARHASDRRPNWDNPPTPGYVAWLLWGGDDAVGWSNKLVRQLDAADKDATDARPEANAMALAGKDRARQAVVDGMQWSDSLAGIAAAEAHDPIRAHARDVAAVIEAATDYEDLQRSLLALLDKDDPALRQTLYRALLLSEGRGAASVAEETP